MSLKSAFTHWLRRLSRPKSAVVPAPKAAPQGSPFTVPAHSAHRSAGTVEVEVMEEVRAAAQGDIEMEFDSLAADRGAAGIPNEWISRNAAGKRPTHMGSTVRH